MEIVVKNKMIGEELYIERRKKKKKKKDFFFNDTAPTGVYTLSLHDALPIAGRVDNGPLALGEHGGGEVVDANIIRLVGHSLIRVLSSRHLHPRIFIPQLHPARSSGIFIRHLHPR